MKMDSWALRDSKEAGAGCGPKVNKHPGDSEARALSTALGEPGPSVAF